jgi:hypothetical protein
MKELIQFWSTTDLKEALMKEAKEKGMSLSMYIRIILSERKK